MDPLRKTSVTRGRENPGSFLVLTQSKRDGETSVAQHLAWPGAHWNPQCPAKSESESNSRGTRINS